MSKPDWTPRIEYAIKSSGLSREEFIAQSDEELRRYPAFGLKTLAFFRNKYGRAPVNQALVAALAGFTDEDLASELNRRRQRRLTDHG